MSDNNTERYLAHQDGFEGYVFYNNKLATPLFIKKYFPKTDGESESQYNRRPKISVPITTSIIDRIVNILNSHTVISVDNTEAQDKMDYLYLKLDLQEFIRDMLVNMLSTGNNLSVIRKGLDTPEIENWDGTYVNFDLINYGINGYEYTYKDGVIVPVLNSDVKEDEIRRVFIDDYLFGDIVHNLGFNPSVAIKSIDKYTSGKYGKPYPLRFGDLAVEFNHIISQMSKSIKILQNIWTSNLSVDNPEMPIRLDPDTVVFLGPNGILQQAARELDLSEEVRLLEILEHHISKSSQVPAELVGLRDAGKLPSGIALQILLQPLVELMDRLRPLFHKKVVELSEKLIKMQYLIEGKPFPKNLNVTVKSDESIFPTDRKERIDEVVLLKREGLIDDITAKLLLEPVLGVSITAKGN
jgi:hypothetical protein